MGDTETRGHGDADRERTLIVNADDFGITEGVNLGIVEAHERGILTSTTLMANMPAFEHAVGQAKQHPTLGVGVHLNLTSGNPVLSPELVQDLLGPSGRLLPIGMVLRQLTLGRLPLLEIEAEFAAQIEKVMAAGVMPTHLDSHHHVHAHPRLHSLIIRLARRYGIRAIRATAELGLVEAISNARMLAQGKGHPALPPNRAHQALPQGEAERNLVVPNLEGRTSAAEIPRALYVKSLGLSVLGAVLRSKARRSGIHTPDQFRGLLLGIAFTAEQLQPVLAALPPGTTELMTHPGYLDDALRQRTSYSAGRDSELAALLAPASRETLARLGARLSSFVAL